MGKEKIIVQEPKGKTPGLIVSFSDEEMSPQQCEETISRVIATFATWGIEARREKIINDKESKFKTGLHKEKKCF